MFYKITDLDLKHSFLNFWAWQIWVSSSLQRELYCFLLRGFSIRMYLPLHLPFVNSCTI